MDKLKYIKIEDEDGKLSDNIPIGADASNIDTADGNNGSTVICNNCIFSSSYNISASLRNIHQQEQITEINVNMNNCYFKTNIDIENNLENQINNNFNLTLLNCNVDNVIIDEKLNNSFEPKIYK